MTELNSLGRSDQPLPDVPAELWERVLQHAFDPASEVMPGVVPDDSLAADIAAAWDAEPVVDDADASAVAALDVPALDSTDPLPADDHEDVPWHASSAHGESAQDASAADTFDADLDGSGDAW